MINLCGQIHEQVRSELVDTITFRRLAADMPSGLRSEPRLFGDGLLRFGWPCSPVVMNRGSVAAAGQIVSSFVSGWDR
jgi:hypothetical protein